MKRVLVLNYEFPPLGGGASPVSYELAKRLSESGDYDIDVVTMHYKGLLKYEEVNLNMRIHRVACLRSKKEMCYPWEQLTYLVTAYFKCRQLIKKQPYDINHTHFIIPTGVLSLVLKKQFGLPYVITSHGSDVLGYNKRFKKLYPLLIKPWKRVLDNAKTIITPSNFLKGEILKVYPEFNTKEIVVIPNGIDTSKFTPQLKTKTIFSSGRLFPNKGFQYLIQAVSDEDLGWEVHIAGDGPMRTELEEMAKKSKTKVFLHGWLDNNGKEYKDLLEQASIFVSASELESFGMVIAEAMNAGCALVCVENTGASEMGGDSTSKVISKSSESIRVTLRNLICGQNELKILQNMALSKSSEYDWNNVLYRYQANLI